MKIQKFNESVNLSINSIKNTINDYHELINTLRPVAIKRYLEIAEDHTTGYGQDIVDVYGGDSFYVIHNVEKIKLIEIKMHDNKIFFTLEYLDSYDDSGNSDIFYVPFTEEELENAIIKMNANKYNL